MDWLFSVDFVTKIFLPVALALMMFSLGTSLNWKDFRRVIEYPGAILLGIILQLLMLPLLAWMIISLCGLFTPLSTFIAAGLIVLAACPGGATSNIIAHLCGGNSALSVSMTAVTSLLIPILLPFSLLLQFSWLDQQQAQITIPVMKTLMQLLVVTVIPVVIAMRLRVRFPIHIARIEPILKKASVWLFVLMVTLLAIVQWHGVVAMGGLVAGLCLLLCISAMVMGWGCARLCGMNKADQKTLAIEIGVQNAGTGIFVAASLLHDPQLALIPLTYGLVMNIPVFLLMLVVRKRSRTHEMALVQPSR